MQSIRRYICPLGFARFMHGQSAAIIASGIARDSPPTCSDLPKKQSTMLIYTRRTHTAKQHSEGIDSLWAHVVFNSGQGYPHLILLVKPVSLDVVPRVKSL